MSNMQSPSAPVVWLAYVSYPVTTAVYFERALRRSSRVITCGPKIGPELLEQWHLQNMKLPVLDHDMPLAWKPDMREVAAAAREKWPSPDLYLWVESVPGYFPTHLEALKCPKACYLIDSHLNLNWHVQWARFFDFVFIAQREYVSEFQRHGCRNVHWLPLACDLEIHAAKPVAKTVDVGFVGTVVVNTRRSQLLKRIAEKNLYLQVQRCFWDDMAELFSRSRIVFNNAIRNDLNMRVFEVMSTGSFLLTDLAANSGQDELFRDGEDLGLYQDDHIVERARHYLIRDEERENIARRAQAMTHQAHTYAHRCAELVRVCLRGQSATPSASEWRERSLAGLSPLSASRGPTPVSPRGRSFIIPVLDASPAGRKDFEALLSDLQKMEGEVIAVFNSVEAAAAFKDHPRIDHSASLNINVGVARAWNIGVHLATQPTVFILNADLRIEKASIESLQQALWNLPAAAVVGPEGSFFGFYTYEDILGFRKGQTDAPQLVDAVSGFLFAAKRELFTRRILQFEDGFTPCLTEEWDLAMQARQAGYRCYVVPVTGYEHAWGISRQPDKTVRYFKNEQSTPRQILSRNRILFWRKWLSIAGELDLPPWEPNGPELPPPAGPALLQSRILEMAEQPGPSSEPV
jgi:hypothetical protein